MATHVHVDSQYVLVVVLTGLTPFDEEVNIPVTIGATVRCPNVALAADLFWLV